MSDVSPIPSGFNSVSAYLVLPNCVEALEFYRKAFGAETVSRMPGPGDSTLHAEMRIGDSMVMMSDENPEWNMKSALTLGGSPVALHLYVNDVDALFAQALEAGCTEEAPLMDAFWGDRYGKLKDPYGISWGVATHKEELTREQLDQRAAEFFASMGDQACES